ncbi:M15 family metallopeptidase [Denitratisoma oestradiolicum]|uniref:D-alanyl-D-alanine carboxypeptidase-like core domain-containing protein n=1 Tax=Denitratisoma oestradiolicum TaxID=311182 RepID=A0A6S6XS36_9PROT|nr:M15 family metallopeptidase [Denitratisoma oestradiolicum]CAB1367535.1 conserved protein of unknown function [Denitratisoma oestradiolicum]
MAADLQQLIPEFSLQVEALLQRCNTEGLPMRPFFTLRSPFEQARLWRQSRSREQIQAQLTMLRARGAPFLAYCIESVGPQHGNPVTNALPGLSWHQWGEAVDCFWLLDGKAEWSATRKLGGGNGYRAYAAAAQDLGLTPGGLWPRLKDWPHVQWRSAGSPLKQYGWKEIDAEMERRFG